MKLIPKTMIVAALVSVLTATAWSADAENEKNWNRVTELPYGARVEVIHSELKRSHGELVHASDSEVLIRSGSGSETIARAEVRRVTMSSRSRKRPALLGLAIGAGVGALAMAAAAHTGDIDIRRDYLAGGGAVIGAGVGAAIGMATAGPVTVYRAGRP